MSMKTSRHRFGRFTLSRDPLELRDGRRLISLPAKQLKVLAVLVEAQGGIVTRKELLGRVWNNSFVEEGNLTQTVFVLRKALGPLSNGAPLIQTVPRKGYRIASDTLRIERSEKDLDSPYTKLLDSKKEDSQSRLLVNLIEDYSIYMLDCAGLVLSWNSGAEKSNGYRSDEIIGCHFSIFFVPEDLVTGIPERQLSMSLRRGRSAGEGWRIRKNGERFWAGFLLTALRCPNGVLLGYGEVVQDLTVRKQREDNLLRHISLVRRECDAMRALFESNPDAVYLCEPIRDHNGSIEDFTVTESNASAKKLFSISRDDSLSQKLSRLFAAKTPTALMDQYKRVMLSGTAYTEDNLCQNKFAPIELVRIHAVRSCDRLVITISDVSDCKARRSETRYAISHSQHPKRRLFLDLSERSRNGASQTFTDEKGGAEQTTSPSDVVGVGC